jgi:colanic acid/amylovoran biosynthesis glycosyltransferase
VVTVAYLANMFPVAVEPYVNDEIQELRRRGIRVIAGSFRRPAVESPAQHLEHEILYLQPLRIWTLLRAAALAVKRWNRISCLLRRILTRGNEPAGRRWKALMHTWLGAYYAVQLQGREVDHIHVHHGYFGSWIGMSAAQLLGINYSLTLHGSDLLTHGAYLDTKLELCRFCITISEYNRQYILQKFPTVEVGKVTVSRLGVTVPERIERIRDRSPEQSLRLLAVGRLHRVKDHAFLIRACAQLRAAGLEFECAIAGDGPERNSLMRLIRKNQIEDRVTLLGHVATDKIDDLYRRSDAVVLTSRSEGIPLVLMEAMARGKPILAPAITGIPELVIPGKTGFLYAPGKIEDLTEKTFLLRDLIHKARGSAVSRLDWVAHAARLQVLHNFNGHRNLTEFGDRFLELIAVP